MLTQEQFDTRWRANPQGCHLWQRSTNRKSGYGTLTVDGYPWLAHRFAYALKVGPIPEGARVLHRCDVRACVNPEHLFLGSARDNSQDMMRKGRGRHRRLMEPGSSPRERGGKPQTLVLTPEAHSLLSAEADRTRKTLSYVADRLIITALKRRST